MAQTEDKDLMKELIEQVSEEMRLETLVSDNHPERESFARFD